MIIFALLVVLFIVRGSEDTWLCIDGEWVKHGVPSAPKPTEPCDNGKIESNELEKIDLIRINTPRPNQVITSPLLIKGEARGYWFFEGDFPVILTNWDGLIIAEGFVTTKEEWMTEDFITFEGTLEFEKPEIINGFSRRGTLILRKDNPSGLPEYDDALEIPVFFE